MMYYTKVSRISMDYRALMSLVLFQTTARPSGGGGHPVL